MFVVSPAYLGTLAVIGEAQCVFTLQRDDESVVVTLKWLPAAAIKSKMSGKIERGVRK